MRGGRAFSMPDRRDSARGHAAPTTPPMRPLRLPPKDNAIPANSGNAPAAQGRHSSRAQRMQPQTVAQGQCRSRQLRQCVRCACRPRTKPFPLTLLMRPLRRRSCAFPPMRLLYMPPRNDTLPRPDNVTSDRRTRTTPFLPTPAMRLPPKDNAIPARCSIMRRLRSHSRTTLFLRPPSIRCGGGCAL